MRFQRSPLAVMTFLAATTSSAAQAQVPAGDFALGSFQPAPMGDPFFSVPAPYASGHVVPRAAFLLDYANQLLIVRSNDRETSLVAAQTFLRADVSLALWDRMLVSIQAPMLLAQRGDGPNISGLDLAPPVGGFSFGDVRLGTRIRLFGENDGRFALGVGGYVFIPTATKSSFIGDGTTRGNVHASAGGRFLRKFVWNASTGFTFRAAEHPQMVTLGGGFGVMLWQDKLQVGPELNATVMLDKTTFDAGRISRIEQPATLGIESLFGARMKLPKDFVVGVAGGPGFGEAIGTPTFRLIAVAGWAPQSLTKKPVAQDHDGDGIEDKLDACPNEAGESQNDGCPRRDRDNDGILDIEDACPTDPGQRSGDPSRHGCPPDADRDGIADAKDACPQEPGVKNNNPARHGCPIDSDEDGISDALDACPTLAGMHVDDPAQRGCPDDIDGDSIKWPEDACPNTRGLPNTDPSKHGCPLVEIRGDELVADFEIRFELYGRWRTSTTVTDEQLRRIRDQLVLHPEIELVEIQGHTDDSGDQRFNDRLSVERAIAVRNWLVDIGVPIGKLIVRGYGQDDPVADNRISEGRDRNRRVIFKIVKRR